MHYHTQVRNQTFLSDTGEVINIMVNKPINIESLISFGHFKVIFVCKYKVICKNYMTVINRKPDCMCCLYPYISGKWLIIFNYERTSLISIKEMTDLLQKYCDCTEKYLLIEIC